MPYDQYAIKFHLIHNTCYSRWSYRTRIIDNNRPYFFGSSYHVTYSFLAHRVIATFKSNSSLNFISFHSLWPHNLEHKSSLFFGKCYERSATWNVSQHYPYSIKMQWRPTGADERWFTLIIYAIFPMPPTKHRRQNKIKFTYFTLLRRTEWLWRFLVTSLITKVTA
jgi:hypothetical protein